MLMIYSPAGTEGMRRLVGEKCDELVKIQLAPEAESLNVAVALGIVLYGSAASDEQVAGRSDQNVLVVKPFNLAVDGLLKRESALGHRLQVEQEKGNRRRSVRLHKRSSEGQMTPIWCN